MFRMPHQKMIFSDLDSRGQREKVVDEFRHQSRLAGNGVGAFENVAGTNILEQKQKRDTTVNDETFQRGFALQELNSFQRGVFGLLFAAPDFYGVDDK